MSRQDNQSGKCPYCLFAYTDLTTHTLTCPSRKVELKAEGTGQFSVGPMKELDPEFLHPNTKKARTLREQELDADIQGDRYNKGKSAVHLIPAEVLLALGEHYRVGAEKYAPNNWRKGLSFMDTAGSLLRHMYAWMSGENIDKETGGHHMIAVVWNAVTLMHFSLFPERYKRFDDRYDPGPRGESAVVTVLNDPSPRVVITDKENK